MALTDQQKADVRWYMGYSVAGYGTAYFDFRELAYSAVSYMGIALDGAPGEGRLNNLSADEEARITGYFLTNLAQREQDIQDAAGNLDTDKAAVWTRNRTEIPDRQGLYTALRFELCRFLGFPPGSALRSQNRLVRG